MGIVVIRVVFEGNLGYDIIGQLFVYLKFLYVVVFMILFFGIFILIGIFLMGLFVGLFVFGVYMLFKLGKEKEEVEEIFEEEVEVDDFKSFESVVQFLYIDLIEFEFGYGLILFVDVN